jgi:hypothetical protein
MAKMTTVDSLRFTQWKAWVFPLVFFQAYLTLTVALFFWGPWPWDVDQPGLLLAYLIAAQIAITLGYLAAGPQVAAQRISDSTKRRNLELGVLFWRRATLLTLIIFIPTSLSRTGSFLPDIISGIKDAGAAYNENFERLEGGNQFVLIEYLRMLMSPWLVSVFPLTIVYWSQLKQRYRILGLTAILATLSLYIATGTNKGIADLVITTPALIYLGVGAGILWFKVGKWALFVSFVLMFFGFLQYFGAGQAQREGGVGELGVINTGLSLIQADGAHALSSILSDNQRIVFESLTRYVVQGYYALSMSFQLETGSTWGFGHSMFLARNADTITGSNAFSLGSVPGQLEQATGWGMFALWHSIYPWLASDFGFLGALIVVGGFAYLLGLSWGKSLMTVKPLWIVMAYLMLITFFYIPANNQIFQTAETCIAFFAVLLSLINWRRIIIGKATRPSTGMTPSSASLG